MITQEEATERLGAVSPELYQFLLVALRGAVRYADSVAIEGNPNWAMKHGGDIFHFMTSHIAGTADTVWEKYGAVKRQATKDGSVHIFRIQLGKLWLVMHSERNKGSASYLQDGRMVNVGLPFPGEEEPTLFAEICYNGAASAGPNDCLVVVYDTSGEVIASVPMSLLAAKPGAKSDAHDQAPRHDVPPAGFTLKERKDSAEDDAEAVAA